MTVRTLRDAILHNADCMAAMRGMADASVDAIVTDPPYELGFMGKKWDSTGIANSAEMWGEALRVLKPGGHLLAFSGSRTYHRMTCAIEDAGFEVRDQIMWVYGSGFPKSLDVSKAIDKAAGAERELTRPGTVQRNGYGDDWDTGSSSDRPRYDAPATEAAHDWQGWGTALKPAHEPICVARKPLAGTVAANVLEFGTGALNIDGCRIGTSKDVPASISKHAARADGVYEGNRDGSWANETGGAGSGHDPNTGRWPANLIHDGSEEVVALFPETTSGSVKTGTVDKGKDPGTFGAYTGRLMQERDIDTGSAARFFYTAKASKFDREAWNKHPTVKPVDLMRYLVTLVTPPGGTVLDPFMGSGSTGVACAMLGFQFIGIDADAEHFETACRRVAQTPHQLGFDLENLI